VKAALTWIVLIILLSGAGLLGGRPGTAAFALSAFTLAFGVLAALILVAVARLGSPARGSSRRSGRSGLPGR
jgi:hypothetical protein